MLQRDVLHLRGPEQLHPVAPSAPLEIIEAALPLGEQLGGDELTQARTVASIPRGLDAPEQRGHLTADICRREHWVVLSRLGRGQLDAPLATPGPPAGCRSGCLMRREPPGRVRREVHHHDRQDQQRDQDDRPDAVAKDRDPD